MLSHSKKRKYSCMRLVLLAFTALLVVGLAYIAKFTYDFGHYKRFADYQVDYQAGEQRFKQAPTLQNMLNLIGGEAEYELLFKPNSLDGWEGDKRLWRIEGQEVIGNSQGFLYSSTYLYSDQRYSDFVLKFDFKLAGEGSPNSGLQYRSQVKDKDSFSVVGYQADVSFEQWSGGLLDEGQRWILAWAGDRLWIDENGGRANLTPIGSREALHATLKPDDWNNYVIIAKGRRLIHQLNGAVFVDIIDDDISAAQSGRIALQLHAGKQLEARFRNLRIKPL